MSNIIFVYGTLKRGHRNYERCLANARFIGEATSVETNFVMRTGGFPILWQVQSDSGKVHKVAKVRGELFEVGPEEMAFCDRLEGHPRMYKREQREFVLTNGESDSIMAWVYLWQNRYDGFTPMKPLKGAYEWTSAGGW